MSRIGMEIDVAGAGVPVCAAGVTPAPSVLTDALTNDVMIYTTTASQRLLFGIGTNHASTVQIDSNGLAAADLRVGNLTITNALILDADLTVACNLKVLSNVTVACNMAVGAVMKVVGTTVLGHDLAIACNIVVGGYTALAQGLAVGGQASLVSLTATGPAALRINAAMGGDMAIAGNVAVGGNQSVAADARVGGSMIVTGDLVCMGALSLPGVPFGDGDHVFRNRVVNGDARVDQRHDGASTLISIASSGFVVDRFLAAVTTRAAGTLSVRRASITDIPVIPSAALPHGFPPGITTALLATVVVSSDKEAFYGTTRGALAAIWHVVEGDDLVDLGWASDPRFVTLRTPRPARLSFWVRTSVAGTYGMCVTSGDRSRTCVMAYVVTAVSAWTFVSMNVPVDAAPAWNDASSDRAHIRIQWILGASADLWTTSAHIGSWRPTVALVGSTSTSEPGGGGGQRPYAVLSAATGNASSFQGATDLMATRGATFAITGIQFGPDDGQAVGVGGGGAAWKAYSTVLQECRRSYEVVQNVCVAGQNALVDVPSTTITPMSYAVVKRVAPYIVTVSSSSSSSSSTLLSTNLLDPFHPATVLAASSDRFLLSVSARPGPCSFSSGLCRIEFDADLA